MGIQPEALPILIDKAFANISARRNRPWQNEEEVRIGWISALESVLNTQFDAERTRRDGSLNNVVVEFKAPGLFRGRKTSAKFQEAMNDRLLPYIQQASDRNGIPQEDFIGIAIDGDHICFAQVRDNHIFPDELLPFSPYSLGLVIAALQADTRRAVSTENLLRDFGHGSASAKAVMQTLSDALALAIDTPGHSKITMLFEEWRTLYGQIADLSVLQTATINGELGFVWPGHPMLAMPGKLFVIHTYNSMLIKMLAAEIVAAHHLTSLSRPAQSLSAMRSDNDLIATLEREIERSGIFEQAGIKGFVEEAIFSWYLDVAKSSPFSAPMITGIRTMLATLSLYRADRLGHTRDVLRDLYQGLVPRKLRQVLGEFYTPDWLVDFTLARLGSRNWLETRALDPTCGSGAFLLAMMRLVRAQAIDHGWSPDQILNHLCQAIWGFDLNPLAVQTARVNVLMEIADLLYACPGHEIEIPVLLADAIYSPASNPTDSTSIIHYQIGSQIAALEITLPVRLARDRERLDRVFEIMGHHVEYDSEYADVSVALHTAHVLNREELVIWQIPLAHTYEQILNLHRKQWNGIWFRIVRNFFWSATAGQFDCIVGNPPWVRWSKLPDAYRNRIKPTCESYGIFSDNRRHGGNELDISAMITYTTTDKWLKTGGRLAFVIRGELFKNPSSAGFRKFRISPADPHTLYLQPVSVDDMGALTPFEDVSNYTVVMVLDKAETPGEFPVPYRRWTAQSGYSRSIPATLSLKDVMQRLSQIDMEAAPVQNAGTPWAVLPPGRFAIFRPMAGSCDWYKGRKGITCDRNGIYFVPILERGSNNLVRIQSCPDAGTSDIGPMKTAWVETELLYPLIKGAGDFEACYLRLDAKTPLSEQLYTFVPNTGISTSDYRDCENRLNSSQLTRTRAWFAGFQSILEKRSTYRRQMTGAPYQAIYNVGPYTFAPWKVIWPEMSTRFYAAVCGSHEVPGVGLRPYVPDHKIYFVAFTDRLPAHFLCGLLNTSLVREWVESHNVLIQVGNIFKHMKLPAFNADDKQHQQLAQAVMLVHAEPDPAVRHMQMAEINVLGEAIILAWLRLQK